MSLSTGIVGLPNVGKSTLFNSITNLNVEAENYPFATIEPNIGIVNVPDERLYELSNLINPQKIVFNTIKFVDIAGLVKGASKGEGLGNKFLSNIKEVDCVCHVIRCFENSNITHVNNKIDSINDFDVINMELILSDIDVINNRIQRINNKVKSGDKESQNEYDICLKILNHLKKENFVNTLDLDYEQKQIIKSYGLITLKPFIYVANVSENDINNLENNIHYINLKNKIGEENIIPLCLKLEEEISKLDQQEKIEFLNLLGIKKTGLEKLILKSYKALNLSTYFTFGKKEVRAWTFKNGMQADECAGIIHSDFKKGFIKAEVISYFDLIKYKSEQKVKENGKMKLVGRDYKMNDGDICTFRFNV